MRARSYSGKVSGGAFFVGALILAAAWARADSDLPPGFTADPNDPFKDSNGPGSGSTHPAPRAPMPMPGHVQPNMNQSWPAPGSNVVPELKPPLSEEAEGSPIDSNQSPNATLSYVDNEVQHHMKIAGGGSSLSGNIVTVYDYYVVYQPGLDTAMAPIVAKFGVANLQEAIRLKPSPRADVGTVNADLAAYEMRILNAALGLATAAASPSQAGVKAGGTSMAQSQDGTGMDMAPPGIPNDGLSDDEVSSRLDALANSTEPDARNQQVLQHALMSTNPAVQMKLATILDRRIDQAQAAASAGAVAQSVTGNQMLAADPTLDLIMTNSVWIHDEPVHALFPKWAEMKVTAARHDGVNDLAGLATLVSGLTQPFLNNADAFASPYVCGGIKELIAPLRSVPDAGIACSFLAAGAGDRNAFKGLMMMYDRAITQAPDTPTHPAGQSGFMQAVGTTVGGDSGGNSQSPGTSPGGGNPTTTAPVANGGPVRNGWEVKPYGDSLIRHTNYVGSGNKQAGILAHLDNAVYSTSTGKWTVSEAAPSPGQAPPGLPGYGTPGTMSPVPGQPPSSSP